MATELEILEHLLKAADKQFPEPISYNDPEVSITVKWNSSADTENLQNTLSNILGIQSTDHDWNLPEVTATFTTVGNSHTDPVELTRNLAWQLVSETTNNDPAAEQITTQFGHFYNIPEDIEEPAAVVTVKILDWFS